MSLCLCCIVFYKKKYNNDEIISSCIENPHLFRNPPTFVTFQTHNKHFVLQRKARGKACRFVEAMGENYFDTFTNVRFPSWLLAFQPNGRPKKGPKTAHGQTDVMFLTFLKRPKHERSLLSTSSPSTLDKETWQELEERIRSQFLSNPHLEMDETITTMTNTPLRTSFTTDAPEIRNELEARRKVLIKVSSINSITTNTEKRKKKRPKRRKSRKSKKKNKSASKVTTIERRESLLVSDSFTTSPPILRISTRITAQETYRRTKPRKHSVKLGRRREHRLSNIKPKPEFDTT